MTSILYLKSVVHIFYSKHVVHTNRYKLYPCPQGLQSSRGHRTSVQVTGTLGR